MAYSAIVKPSDYFNTVLYTGSNSTQSVTGVGFQPDWVWIKNRTSTPNHMLNDAVRTAGKQINSDTTSAELDRTYFQSFDSDGFSLDANVSDYNQSGSNFVSWNWKANGAGSANTDGTISSTVSVNTTSGFSIVKYVGNASAGATIGHGLGVVPKVMIVKSLSGAYNWGVYHAALGNFAKYLYLDASNAEATDSGNFDNVPTSSTFLVGSNNTVNKSGDNYIAYCFAEKQGYSKFGSYVGNGSTDGTFVYTGFKPAWVLVKSSSLQADWELSDNKRTTSGGNVIDKELRPNTSSAETGGTDGRYIDYYSNGFKLRQGFGNWNDSGATYIYMAFAEAPLVANSGSNGVPATAR